MSDELESAITAVIEAQQRLEALAGTKLDSIIGPSGISILLPQAQQHLWESESALRQSVELLSTILDALPANIALLDRSGRVSMVNKRWRDFAEANGFAGSDFGVGDNYLDVCTRTTDEFDDQPKVVTDGIQSVLNQRAVGFAAEYPCHSPNERRWFQLIAAPMPAVGEWGAVVLHVDITARKFAEIEAQELRHRLETLVEEANIGILVHNDFKPLLANPALAGILGYADKEAIMALPDCRVIYAEEERLRATEYNAARRSTGVAPELYVVRARKMDGSIIDVESRAFAIDWDGDKAVCALITDVSERRSTELQLLRSQRLEAVGQLTGGIAHDFNNLLQVILGNSELLEADLPHDSKFRRLAADIKSAAERGAQLTQRMLAFARRQPLAPDNTDINALILGMTELLGRTLGKDIELDTVCDGGAWSALVDAAQLESAILNLCINARDAMPRGGKLIIETTNVVLDDAYVREETDLESGQYVLILVSDNGLGMEADVLTNAFEPFFTTKDVGKGSGLGLSMVYGFAKQSKGHVKIYSEPGKGTIVRLYLPRAIGSNRQPVVLQVDARPPGGSENVLMVEDDELVRVHVHQQLLDLGYSVTTATNGREALKLLEQEGSYDLLFTDIVMPGGIDGQQLAQAALEIRPGLPVLFTSGYTDNALMDQGRLATGMPLLVKPYRKRQLALKIREVLDAAHRLSSSGKGH